jgi:hypothetical protein
LNPGFRATTLLFFSLSAYSIAAAQANPTAVQPLQISAFGAATGTWTGLNSGRNIGITAGVDVGWKPFYRFYPSVEVRGTYPIADGQVDAQKIILYGFKAARFYGRFHPYANFLIGRDKIVYQDGGFPNSAGTLLYLDSVSNVFSYGGGLDFSINDQFSLKVDGQFQQIGVPVNATGHIYSKPLSVGIVYRFDFNHHIHYNSDGSMKGYKPPPEPKPAPVPPPGAPETPAPGNPAPDNSAPNNPPADNAAPAPAPASPAPDNSAPTAAPDNSAPTTAPSKPSPDTPAPNPPSIQQPQ